MNRNLPTILILIMALAANRIVASGATNSLVATNSVAATNSTLAKVPFAKTAPIERAPVESAPVKVEAKDDFKAFQLIMDRNIFDMSRTGAHLRNTPVHVAKVDDFTLVGTMSYEKGKFAFFDGSSSEYRQTSKLAGSIADYKVAAIADDYVELQTTNNKTIKMFVGTTIRREDKGPWSAPSVRSDTILADVGSSSRARSDRSSRGERRDRGSRGERSSSTDAGTSAPVDQKADASSGGSEDDVIKRLMEKRAKEVKSDQ